MGVLDDSLCTNPPCGKSKGDVERMFWCSSKGCGRPYCSPECQKQDWQRHKPICRRLKERAIQAERPPPSGFEADPTETGLEAEMTKWVGWASARLSFDTVQAFNLIDSPNEGNKNLLSITLSRTKETENHKKFFRIKDVKLEKLGTLAVCNPAMKRFLQQRILSTYHHSLNTWTMVFCGRYRQIIPYSFMAQHLEALKANKARLMNPRWKEQMVIDVEQGIYGDIDLGFEDGKFEDGK